MPGLFSTAHLTNAGIIAGFFASASLMPALSFAAPEPCVPRIEDGKTTQNCSENGADESKPSLLNSDDGLSEEDLSHLRAPEPIDPAQYAREQRTKKQASKDSPL